MIQKLKINQLKVGAGISYISMILGYLIAIIYTPIMIRLLGKSEYGLYNLVYALVAYLSIFNFGFGSAYIRFYSRFKLIKDDKNIKRLNGMYLIIFIVICMLVIFVGVIFFINTNKVLGPRLTEVELIKAKELVIYLVINLIITFINIVFNSYITANEKFIFQKIIQLLKVVLNPFVVVPVLLLGYGVVGMAIAMTALNLLISLLNAIYCLKNLKMRFSFQKFNFRLMKEISIFSSYIFINLVIDQINWNLDKYILGRSHGTTTVAVYGLAAQLNTYYIMIASAISNVFIPRIHRIVLSKDNNCKLTEIFSKIGRIQFIILLLILTMFIFFGKPFIIFWAGRNYETTYYVMLFLIIPVTIPLIQNIGIEIQRAKNMHRFRSCVYFFISIINVFITIILVNKFSSAGAAAGTGISLIIGNGFIMNWYYHKKVRLDIKYFWKEISKILIALVVPLIVGIYISIKINIYDINKLFIFGMIYIIIFSISMWFVGMNETEKELVSRPFFSLTKKIKKIRIKI